MDETATLTTGWEPDTPLDDSIVRQVVFAWWWIVLSSWPLPRDLPEGIALVGHPPLMLRPPGPYRVAQPAGLHVCRVEDRQRLVDFDAVLKAGVPRPRDAAVADQRLLGHDLPLLVGYDDDQPVATAGAWTTGGSSRSTGSPPFPLIAIEASGRP